MDNLAHVLDGYDLYFILIFAVCFLSCPGSLRDTDSCCLWAERPNYALLVVEAQSTQSAYDRHM